MTTVEAISKIAGRQSGESSGALTHSAPRLARLQKLQVGEMLGQMAAIWPAQEEHLDTAKMYQAAMEELAAEFGLPEVEQALRWFLTRTRWFPHPSEVREELEAMAKKKQQQERIANPIGPCAICIGTRLVLFVKDGERYAKDCECVLNWRAKKSQAQLPLSSAGESA